MKLPAVLLISALFASSGSLCHAATTLLAESFTYPDGNLAGNGNWTAHSGAGSLPVQVTGGQAVIAHGSGSREDVNATFTAQTVDILQATFDFSVSAGTTITNTDNEYFAHFGTGSTSFFARMDIVAPTGAGDFTVGIAGSGGAAEGAYGTDFSFDTVHTAVLRFNLDTGESSVSIDGGSFVFGTTTITGLTLDAFYLRQSTSGQSESITIDNLTIESVPEPSIALLGGLGLLGLIRRRR